MIDRPSRYIKDYLDAGADLITFHVEAEPDVKGTLRAIRAGGAKASLSLKPARRPRRSSPIWTSSPWCW